MNKVIILVIYMLLAINGYAQQKPHYTQYILNQYIINPALSGIENYIDVKVSHRHQWTGLSGGPVTSYVTIQGPINKKDYHTTATSFAVPGENPRGQRYWENFTAAAPHHGVGMQLINDVTGPLSNLSLYGTYAYHIGLTPRTSLSAGFGAGFSRFSLNSSSLNFNNTTVDPVVYSSGILNKTKFDMTAGVYLYSADYFIGVSAQQIVPNTLSYSDHTITTTSGKTVPHIFITGGYRFLITEDLNLTPSLMVKYVNPLPLQVEVNTKLQYRDMIWIGASYRHKDSFAGMVGFNISNTVNLGYSYDNATTALAAYNRGTHELVLGFTFGNKYDDGCPRNVW